MTGLNMISLPLPVREFRQWSARQGLSMDEGRALHHLLGETFGKSALQPFRLMIGRDGAQGTIYAYTRSEPDALQDVARETGTPDAMAICPPRNLSAKAMPETWTVGRRLSFDVRVRPIRRLNAPTGQFAKGAELDAFLTEALRHSPDGTTAEDAPKREDVYARWLDERLGGAAELVDVRLVRYQRRSVLRGGRKQDGPDATLHGELVIHDAEDFSQRLAKGVGRHTAYGYGMLLLRPA